MSKLTISDWRSVSNVMRVLAPDGMEAPAGARRAPGLELLVRPDPEEAPRCQVLALPSSEVRRARAPEPPSSS